MRTYFAFLHSFDLTYALISLARFSYAYTHSNHQESLPAAGLVTALVCGVLMMPGVKIVRMRVDGIKRVLATQKGD